MSALRHSEVLTLGSFIKIGYIVFELEPDQNAQRNVISVNFNGHLQRK